jgi:rod shape-determining protein MreD
MLRKGRFALCIAALFLVQATVMHRFSYRFLRPDLLLAAAAFLTLEGDYRAALWGVFAVGLLRDFGSASALGAGPLVLVPVTAVVWHLKTRLVREAPWTDLALTFAYAVAAGFLWTAGAAAFTRGRLADLLPLALGQAAFTAALAPLLFALLSGMGIVRESARA